VDGMKPSGLMGAKVVGEAEAKGIEDVIGRITNRFGLFWCFFRGLELWMEVIVNGFFNGIRGIIGVN
jgi:hypothetical protein